MHTGIRGTWTGKKERTGFLGFGVSWSSYGFLFPYFLCLEVEFCLPFFACIYYTLGGKSGWFGVLFCGAGRPIMPLDFSRSLSLLCTVAMGVVLWPFICNGGTSKGFEELVGTPRGLDCLECDG